VGEGKKEEDFKLTVRPDAGRPQIRAAGYKLVIFRQWPKAKEDPEGPARQRLILSGSPLPIVAFVTTDVTKDLFFLRKIILKSELLCAGRSKREVPNDGKTLQSKQTGGQD
jgi:hypothetical protein